MTQRELNRRVADATGESVRTIASMGFGPLTRRVEEHGPEAVDWDEVDGRRGVVYYPRRKRPATAF